MPMNRTYFLGAFLLILLSCKSDAKKEALGYQKISGKTMGTTYNITYFDSLGINYQKSIDSLLIEINNSVSTYIPSSTISKINNHTIATTEILINGKIEENTKLEIDLDSHFLENYNVSLNIYENTDGYFDPTIAPLVNYWGFGYTAKKAITKIDRKKVKELRSVVGMNKFNLKTKGSKLQIIKPSLAKLDFSAIAKGYAVDFIAKYLESKKVSNYLVEIGGEVYAKGLNQSKSQWKLGINKPQSDAPINVFEIILNINDKGLASSGNYRNYYETQEWTYGHEINPFTGFPEMGSLLGVSVIGDNCMVADAYATAFMIMGLEKSKQLTEQIKGLEACFFYLNNEEILVKDYSSGFEAFIVQ